MIRLFSSVLLSLMLALGPAHTQAAPGQPSAQDQALVERFLDALDTGQWAAAAAIMGRKDVTAERLERTWTKWAALRGSEKNWRGQMTASPITWKGRSIVLISVPLLRPGVHREINMEVIDGEVDSLTLDLSFASFGPYAGLNGRAYVWPDGTYVQWYMSPSGTTMVSETRQANGALDNIHVIKPTTQGNLLMLRSGYCPDEVCGQAGVVTDGVVTWREPQASGGRTGLMMEVRMWLEESVLVTQTTNLNPAGGGPPMVHAPYRLKLVQPPQRSAEIETQSTSLVANLESRVDVDVAQALASTSAQPVSAGQASAKGPDSGQGEPLTSAVASPAELQAQQCDAGHVGQCVTLANTYALGSHEVAVDLWRAAVAYGKACDLGDASSCNTLGLYYAHGSGVAQDFVRAVQLFQNVCNDRTVEGCVNLGAMYWNGAGVPHDTNRAAALHNQACAGGDPEGCRFMEKASVAIMGTQEEQRAENAAMERENAARGAEGLRNAYAATVADVSKEINTGGYAEAQANLDATVANIQHAAEVERQQQALAQQQEQARAAEQQRQQLAENARSVAEKEQAAAEYRSAQVEAAAAREEARVVAANAAAAERSRRAEAQTAADVKGSVVDQKPPASTGTSLLGGPKESGRGGSTCNEELACRKTCAGGVVAVRECVKQCARESACRVGIQ